jgi:MHS family citrate/tricarballylate:H+ symporter-like MFS transporter
MTATHSMAQADQAPPGLSIRTILAATLGNGLEFYDFVTYGFFAIQIGHAFFPMGGAFGSLMLSLATFGAGFITRPIGAFFIGAYADRAGRRAAMTLSFALMGASVLFMALIPSYATIGIAAPLLALTARLVQGFSLGGEVGPNLAYLLEAAKPRHRGLAASLQGVSQQVATMIAALVGLTLSLTLPHAALDAYGWRIAFLIGGATLPVGVILRRKMPETLDAPTPDEADHAIGGRLSRVHVRIILLSFLALSNATIATYVKNYLTTFAQDSLKMAPTIAFMAGVLPALASIGAMVVGGWMSDRFGRRPMMIGSRALYTLATLPIFYWIVSTKTAVALLTGGILLAIIDGPASAALYGAMTESLPKASRGRSIALIYALAISLFGGTTQLVVTELVHVTGNLMSPAFYLLGANQIGLTAMSLMPESAPVKRKAV